MRTWLAGFFRALGEIAAYGLERFLHPLRGLPPGEGVIFLVLAFSGLGATVILGQVSSLPGLHIPVPANLDNVRRARPAAPPVGPLHDLHKPLRDIPADCFR